MLLKGRDDAQDRGCYSYEGFGDEINVDVDRCAHGWELERRLRAVVSGNNVAATGAKNAFAHNCEESAEENESRAHPPHLDGESGLGEVGGHVRIRF
jgi:hypothetical protein